MISMPVMDRGLAIGLSMILFAAAVGGLRVPAGAAEPEVGGLEELLLDGEHCVSLMRIQRTDVLDDRSILFYMKGGQIYLNRLPHRCPGLRWERAFMYRTSLSKLCDLDIITVLDNLGFGYSPGVSCGLGMFFPISEGTAKALKAAE